MAVKPPPAPWDLLQQMSQLASESGLKGEVDKGVRSLAQSALGKLDLVSREEFDAQSEVLRRTRARVEELEAELEALGKQLDQLADRD
ncbi:accessory factor UbiK family protein [Haliea sp. E17]|uniref:accessory factor UbiK family protein n=1 Tax=Haliea sp. E17 TaxID=3401576 RepID=UPI003AAAFFA3